ncbi:MAG: cation-transporting P-type ATPase [Saprospiraceae bacterium]|nr:cation-transporting P-type ATPase [Saprospiraceae bacterium]
MKPGRAPAIKAAAINGLTTSQVAELREEYGKNEIIRKKKISAWSILLNQFASPLILILVIAAGLSLLIGYLPMQEPREIDAILIMSIVLLSGLFGFFQDYRAERTIETLQAMATPISRVIRDGVEHEISSIDIVPGDILEIKAGDLVGADGVVVQSNALQLDESILTGESLAIRKAKGEEVFMHTHATSGSAMIKVTQTGMGTRVGEIAGELQEIAEEKTSFQRELADLGRKLSLFTLVITLVVGVAGYFKFGLYQGLMTAISLAVAAIPEGLPAVVVLGLAIGARAMVQKKALIRRLSVAESIGAVDLICTDKTGTLTKNEMSVTKYFINGEVSDARDNLSKVTDITLQRMLQCSFHCNNVETSSQADETKKWSGEQTEIAILQFALDRMSNSSEKELNRIDEIPFSSERKMMTVVVEDGIQQLTYTKGAPEVVIEKCSHVMLKGEILLLAEDKKRIILNQTENFASQALRVMGFAFKEVVDGSPEKNLIWLGLMGMTDLPRPEAKEALAECHSAGIRVIMITGDNPTTAKAIASEVGMKNTEQVLTGPEIDLLQDEELRKRLDAGSNIFARTTPMHKLRILNLLENDYTVAMTGDGVNDALAIKRASVGIAMGQKGTEVTKQVADIILLDDNFSTIRDAIRHGRTIFQNIRKFIDYLLTCNIAEVLVIFIATLYFDLEGPVLLAVQILWINLLTDGLVALALGADPPAYDVMKHSPRKLNEPLINKRLAWLIGLIGLKLTAILLIAFWVTLPLGLEKARTVLLSGFVLYEFVRIGAIRSQEQLGWFDNKWLIAALLVSMLLQLAIVYTPLNEFFSLVPIGAYEWIVLISGAVVGGILAFGITKLVIKLIPQH